MAFHARDGFFFERLGDGSVAISVEVPVRDAMGKATGDRAMLHRIQLPENEWASVLASVCGKGEDGDTWAAARRFHAVGGDNTPTDVESPGGWSGA